MNRVKSFVGFENLSQCREICCIGISSTAVCLCRVGGAIGALHGCLWADAQERELPSVPSESYPERPGEPDCPYFLKTEKCKFGLNCKFNHPKDKLAASGNASALPDRPSEPLCAFYMKTGKCKFGEACKFHHPKNIQIPLAGQEAGNLEKNISVPNAVTNNDVDSVKNQISSPALSYNSKGLPIRLGEMDCPFYIKTGSCKYGVNCRCSHPDRNELLSPFSVINPPAATIGHSVLTSSVANLNAGLLNPAASILQSLSQTTIGPGYPTIYPQRPGQIECDYYMKTGECKFGERCRFHHPIDRSAPKLTLAGLPRREVQKIQLLTPNIGVVYSGMGPDSRVLVRKSRKQAEQYHRLYKEPIPVTQLVRETAAVMQEFTQSGGVRPFGVSLLIAGFDDNGPQLYQWTPLVHISHGRPQRWARMSRMQRRFLRKGIRMIWSLMMLSTQLY